MEAVGKWAYSLLYTWHRFEGLLGFFQGRKLEESLGCFLDDLNCPGFGLALEVESIGWCHLMRHLSKEFAKT
ncbi:MAG: hypothetical protein DRQ37_06415 [Gammaproteobacteria bacterium]|nr:MAG: hypothetical protein DRQ37_06415 [Gammaproteobacteria bacterium]